MFEDKVLKHKRAEGYYRRNAALGNVDGAWKNFVEANKVPDPSSMKLAELPRSEWDNFNTPDLEQTPDSVLKPGETLEDFDVTFRRPNADGGRIGFYEGGDYNRSKMKKLADAFARQKYGRTLTDLPDVKRFEMEDLAIKSLSKDIEKKADGGRIGYKLGKKVVETVIKKAGEGKFTKNEVLLNMFQNTIKGTKDANTKTRFINFIEEIKLKPELSKDPNVWNFFTKGLPKNQKLVVYGDDTVDFWTQSDFGPHNIATSAKFQKKHPYLTKDQAVKIQNMEPEDQIFEMKRLEAIRKRTANASGGIAAMLGE